MLHLDQGHQFDFRLIKELCSILQRKESYHTLSPTRDGLVEWFNRNLLDMLAANCKANPIDWKSYAQPFCYAYNTSVHMSTVYSSLHHYNLVSHLSIQCLLTNIHGQLQNRLYRVTWEMLGVAQDQQQMLYNQTIYGKPFGMATFSHSKVIVNSITHGQVPM